VRVIGTRVHLELGGDGTAELVARQHALDGLLDDAVGTGVHGLAQGLRLQAARETGVAVLHHAVTLVGRDRDLVGVDDDDEVAGVGVRGELRLVLATEDVGDLDGESTENHISGVDDVPGARHVPGLGGVRGHRRYLCLSSGLPAGRAPSPSNGGRL